MKKQLLTLAALLIIFASCSKDSDSPENKKITLGNDSLVTRLNLKISDKTNLSIKSQIFTTRAGYLLISGIKDNKYWLGLFDKSGNQLLVKRYDQDPTVNGKEYFYNSFSIREGISDLFIVRQIREGNVLNPNSTSFDEANTKINFLDYTINVSYNKYSVESGYGYTSFFSEWQKETYAISNTKTDKFGLPLETTVSIFDKTGKNIGKFSGYDFNRFSIYIPIDSKYIIELGNDNTTNLLININNIIKPYLQNGPVLINSKEENGIVTMRYTIFENNFATTTEIKINRKYSFVMWQ